MTGAGRVRLLAMGGTIAVMASPDGALHALGADELAALYKKARGEKLSQRKLDQAMAEMDSSEAR